MSRYYVSLSHITYMPVCTVSPRLFGNYESLDGGELSEALEDFTGGVADTVDLLKLEVAQKIEERVSLFARMQKEVERHSLMAASIPVSRQSSVQSSQRHTSSYSSSAFPSYISGVLHFG